MAVRLTGELDVAAMERGLQEIPEDVRKVKLRRLVREDIRRPFDLRHGPLLRATLLKLGEQEHALLLTMHHIISDAWSMELFFHELKTLYVAYASRQSSPLPEVSIQYADYAIWQQEWLQGEVLETQLAYWKQQLADLPVLQLPIDHPRPAVQTFRGAAQIMVLPRSLTGALKTLSRQEGVTLFMTLLAAYQTLISRYTEQDDIVVGIPIAGRTESKLEGVIGCFINTLALRTDLSGNPTFRELLGRVREVALGAYAHQDIPFEKLVEELQPDRDLSRNPLTQVMFALQNVPRGQVSLPGLTLSPLKLDSETAMLKSGDANWMSRQQNLLLDSEPAMFDLDLTMWERADELVGELKYNTDLFDPPTIERMQSHFLTLLEAVVADPSRRIADLPLLSEAEQQQLLMQGNATQAASAQEQSFHERFEAQVARTPEAVAVVCAEQYLTYQQLNQRANQLAQHLRARGVGPETLVGLLAERGLPLLSAILAVFKAGGAYLPLDPQHPAARLQHIVQRSQCRLVLVSSPYLSTLEQVLQELPAEARPRVLALEELVQQEQAQEKLPIHPAARQLAYVIYTSGSSGVPKGVMVEQAGMLNHLDAKIEALQLSTADRVAQTASQCFDISVWQFLAALLVGGRVHISPDEVTQDPVRLLQQVEQQRITILETVPSWLRAMLDIVQNADKPGEIARLTALRWMVPTGEALPVEL